MRLGLLLRSGVFYFWFVSPAAAGSCPSFLWAPSHTPGKAARAPGKVARHARAPGSDAWDDEMAKAAKTWEKMEAKKDRKREARQAARAAAAPSAGEATGKPRRNSLGVNPFGVKKPASSRFGASDVASVEFMGSYTGSASEWPQGHLPEVAFLGRSNVGKSSMLNTLFGEAVARVSKMPGRTQQLNLFAAKNAAGKDLCWLMDLPGYGYAKIGKDSQKEIESLLESYLRERTNLRLLVLLVDARREPLDADAAILQFAETAQVPYQVLVAATKVDKLSPLELATNTLRIRDCFSLPPGMPLQFSSATGRGKGELWQYIIEAAKPSEEERR